MALLSGDQATPFSGALVFVRRRGAALPSAGAIQRSLTSLSGSYDGSSTGKTTHLPSGLAAGAPTRFIIQSLSWVIGVLGDGGVAAIVAREIVRQVTTRATRGAIFRNLMGSFQLRYDRA